MTPEGLRRCSIVLPSVCVYTKWFFSHPLHLEQSTPYCKDALHLPHRIHQGGQERTPHPWVRCWPQCKPAVDNHFHEKDIYFFLDIVGLIVMNEYCIYAYTIFLWFVPIHFTVLLKRFPLRFFFIAMNDNELMVPIAIYWTCFMTVQILYTIEFCVGI